MSNKKTKIVLINPPLSAEQQAGSLKGIVNVIPPLGIGYIAAVLKKEGYDVKIIDSVPLKLTKEKVLKVLKKIDPKIIAFTATIITMNHAIETAKYIKENFNKETKFVIGGPQFTAVPERTTKKASVFDFGIIGEGEESFLELVEKIEKGKIKESDLKKIKSLVWYKNKGKKNEKIIINPRRDLTQNLDDLPYPARELFPPQKFYTPMPGGYKRLPFGHMITSRGCPYRCTFCDRSVFGQMFRARSAKNVVEEIEFLVKKYKVREIKFYDDLFTKDKKRVHEICDEILKRKLDITWSCSARVDSVDYPMLKKMKKAGCWQIDYGIESGNQEVLNRIKKGITLKQSEQAVRWTKKAGIKARSFIIIGMPGETKQSIEDTIRFVKKIPLDVVTFYAVMIYPGNELYEIVKKEGKLKHENFDEFTSLIDVKKTHLHYVPEGLTEKYIKKSISRAYKEFYLRPSYLFRQAISIRGLTDIKRYWAGFKAILRV